MPQAFYKIFRSRIFGFSLRRICENILSSSEVPIDTPQSHYTALAVHDVLSTCCQRKTHLALPSIDEMKPKAIQPLEKPLANSSKQTRPIPGASSGQAPTAGATTEEWRELETTKCQLLWVGSMYELLCYSYDMLDAS